MNVSYIPERIGRKIQLGMYLMIDYWFNRV